MTDVTLAAVTSPAPVKAQKLEKEEADACQDPDLKDILLRTARPKPRTAEMALPVLPHDRDGAEEDGPVDGAADVNDGAATSITSGKKRSVLSRNDVDNAEPGSKRACRSTATARFNNALPTAPEWVTQGCCLICYGPKNNIVTGWPSRETR